MIVGEFVQLCYMKIYNFTPYCHVTVEIKFSVKSLHLKLT